MLQSAISDARQSMRVMQPAMPHVPEKLNAVASCLSERMDRVGVITADFDLKTFSRKVEKANNYADWTLLSNSDLRRIAVVLRSSDFPIGRNLRFLRRYLQEIRNRGQLLPCRALVGHYLRHFDNSEDIKEIGGFLSGVLLLPGLRNRLRDWNERHSKYHLFEPGVAATHLANNILEEHDADRVFADAGIRGDAQTAGIGAEAFKSVCGRIRESLTPESGVEAINLLTGWASPTPGELRYQNHRSTLADAVLLPWRYCEPGTELKKVLESFFDAAYGDPRFQKDRWQGTSIQAREVRISWLAEKDLEFFFKVVDSTTGRRDQWKYRRAFWSAYVSRGLTKGSWIAFGAKAQVVARQAAREAAATEEGKLRYGRLVGGDSRHSVLFLRIDNLVIADWSFNGRLRIWRDGNPTAPNFYQTKEPYNNRFVRRGADRELVHWPVKGWGNWQGKAEEFIRRHTGIQIAASDYMPDKKSAR